MTSAAHAPDPAANASDPPANASPISPAARAPAPDPTPAPAPILPLPDELRALIDGLPCTADDIGRSRAQVLLYPDRVLKIAPAGAEMARECALLRWLEGRLPAPRVLWQGEADGHTLLLMTRLRGRMACDRALRADPQRLVRLLADALRTLWAVDISDLPAPLTLAQKLEEARARVEAGLCDMDNCEPETFGPGGFASPAALLDWLCANRPDEQPVFSHGDFCLPNVFFDGDAFSGLLDFGRAGLSDRWQDLALCYRSLRDNFGGHYGAAISGFSADTLFAALGIAPDRERLHYYLLLDELF